MLDLSNEQICLLELIKASLFSVKPFFPENVDWNKVFELAKTQCIVALVEPAVVPEYRERWKVAAYQNTAHFIKISYEQNRLVQMFKNHNIPMVIFKGMAAAMYYPEPIRRTMGDIDFYVPADSFSDAKSLLDNSDYSFVSENSRHIEYKKNDMEFELHRKVGSVNYNDIENFISEGINQVEEYSIKNFKFYGFPKYVNGLILLGHFMQHLKGTGIGIRHLIDWMMYVHKELDDISWNQNFKHMAEEAGLEKLAGVLTFICKKWLGLPDEIVWCDDYKDDELVESMLEHLLLDGNFGLNRSKGEKVQINMKKKGFFAFLQQKGIINWKLAQKYFFLRPFAWVYQLCHYAKKGFSEKLSGKKVFRKRKATLKIEEIWRRLE